MSRSAIIEIHKEALKFSAGHLMLLSADARETLHGHDYQVSVALHTDPGCHGFAIDLREYHDTLLTLCQQLDFRFLVPGTSPFLLLHETETHWDIRFQQNTFSLLKSDAVILPLPNITLEELSGWFLDQLIADRDNLAEQGILGIQVKVFNGRHESGATCWNAWEKTVSG